MTKRDRDPKPRRTTRAARAPKGRAVRSRETCKACTHPQAAEINRRLLAKESLRRIEAWTKGTGAPLSIASLSRHKTAHISVTAEAKRLIADRQAPVTQAAEKVVAEVELLDEVASLGLWVARGLAARMRDPDAYKSQAEVLLFTNALREVREAVSARDEILNGKKVNVDAVVSGGLAGLYAELERRSPVADEPN